MQVDEATRQQLSRIAATSGGTYHDADSEQELAEALNNVNDKASEPPTPEVGHRRHDRAHLAE